MAFKKIRFVTDSTCDIPEDLIEKWQITVVPAFVNIGDESYADDGVQLKRDDFYARLPTMTPFPTTAAPSPGVAKAKIEAAFANADHVVIICAPAKLSAIYEALRLGANNIPPDQVTLIDSQFLSMGLGYQVLIGAEVAAETGDVDQVVAAVDKVRAHSHLNVMLNGLDNLRRSGRVNLATAGVGTLLQIKPILEVANGEVKIVSRVRTVKRARAELVDLLRAEAPFERLTLLHTNHMEGIEWLQAQVSDLLPEQTYVINATPVLGTHIGPQCLGFASLRQDWRL
jgi:DegV family protein with EDD domain